MKIKLSYKFFIAFSVTSLLIVALLIGIMQFFVYHNFTDYVNRVELEKLGEITNALANEYSKYQAWEPFKKNPRKWHEILRTYLPQDAEIRRNTRPPRHPPDFNQHPPPPFEHGFPLYTGNKPDAPKDRPPIPGDAIGRRLSLFDNQNNLIIGYPIMDDQVFKEIISDGKTVGRLGLKKKENLSNPLDTDFLKQQSKAFLLIGFAILLLAAAVSFFLSKHLLAPIRQLAKGTKALSLFKFDTKVEIHTRDELGQLADNFNLMAETLKKYEDMRLQWISDISHELRTPLSILRGEIEAIQDGIRKINKETINSLHSEVLRLSRLVDDLHLLSQADSQNLRFKNNIIEPILILENTVKSFFIKFESRNIAVQADLSNGIEIKSKGDKDRLIQLFSNLLENTLKYTDSPGLLKIYYFCSENMLIINFEDTPPGVPDKALKRIFDRLYRVDKSRSRAMGGSGLGLSICKQIVEAHHGTIRAEKSTSGGLLIIIELPLLQTDISRLKPGNELTFK